MHIGAQQRILYVEPITALSRQAIQQVPDLFLPITGYRAWDLRDPAGFQLTGLTFPVPWRLDGSIVARCTTPGSAEAPPGPACSCGIYAFRDARRLFDEGTGAVRGAVDMWGRIIEHEDGFRAEFARLSAMFDDGPQSRFLAPWYDVPLVKVPRRGDVAPPVLSRVPASLLAGGPDPLEPPSGVRAVLPRGPRSPETAAVMS